MKLTVKDIEKSFYQATEEISLFKDFSMELSQGEVRIIMGPSGCGKTTLLRIIKGLEKPDKGQVLFDDFSLYDVSEDERRNFHSSSIGFADQRAVMLPQLTALENVLLPTIGYNHNAPADGDFQSRAKELLNSLGLKERSDHFPHELSGGERQRVAWARALILEPALLLLDEPTSALEQSRSHRLLSLLASINKEKAVSMIIATHDPMACEFFPQVTNIAPESES